MLEDIDKYDSYRICDRCGNKRKVCKRNGHYKKLQKQDQHLCPLCARGPQPSRKGMKNNNYYWPIYMKGQYDRETITFDHK